MLAGRSRRLMNACATLLLLVLVPLPLAGQRHASRFERHVRATEIRPVSIEAPAPAPLLAAGGIAGGVFGYFVGHSAVPDRPSGPDDEFVSADDLRGFAAWAGVSLGIPIGVHIANRGRGSWGASLLSSVAIGALGGVLLMTMDSGFFLYATPAAQLWSSVAIERRTTP